VKLRYGLSLLAAILAACSGGGGSPSTSMVPSARAVGGTSPITPASSSTFSYSTQALQGARLIATASNLASISADLVPQMQNATGLMNYAKAVSDPKSADYRHFLTPQQIGDRYGASETTYDAAIKYFQSQGISVAVWPQRLLLHVTGPQAKMQSALHTTFGWYSNGKQTFLAPESTPAPPASIGIVGATNIVMVTNDFTDHVDVSNAAANGAGNGVIYGYSPQQIASAFDYQGAYAAGYTGTGITTGVIGTGPFSPADVPAYKQMLNVGGSGTVTVVSATDANAPGNTALGFATPPPVTLPSGFCVPPYSSEYPNPPSCNPEDTETQLDTEQLASLAPGANLRYYLAYNPADGCGVIGVDCPAGTGQAQQGLAEADAEINTAIADDTEDVLSLSFGGPETLNVGGEFNASGEGVEPLEFAALASEGIAVFVSSGDSGAEGCAPYVGVAPNPDALCVSYPATDPNVVAVGGVNTPMNTAGQLLGPITGWGTRSGGADGSGGGVSAYFPLSTPQTGAAGITGTMRNVPDIALDGDALTGVTVLMYGGSQFAGDEQILPIGGTSVAAPEAAAMWALVLQACKQTSSCATATGPYPYRLGNPAAYFYKIYANSSEYASTIYDVVYGSNALSCTAGAGCPSASPTYPGYIAGPGYDLVSGVGVPYARALIKAVVGV